MTSKYLVGGYDGLCNKGDDLRRARSGATYALLLIRLKSVSTSQTKECLAHLSQVELLSRPSHLS